MSPVIVVLAGEQHFSISYDNVCLQPMYCISASHLVSILHFQSISLSYSLALSSPLDNLSCNAAPGALLNLLLLAGRPGNINKPRETMERLNEHHTRIVAHHKGTGRRPPHFLCHCRESSTIILLHFCSSCFHPHLLHSFPHFPSLLTYTLIIPPPPQKAGSLL